MESGLNHQSLCQYIVSLVTRHFPFLINDRVQSPTIVPMMVRDLGGVHEWVCQLYQQIFSIWNAHVQLLGASKFRGGVHEWLCQFYQRIFSHGNTHHQCVGALKFRGSCSFNGNPHLFNIYLSVSPGRYSKCRLFRIHHQEDPNSRPPRTFSTRDFRVVW